MRYVSGKVGCYESLEYAKMIINKIGNLVSYEIFNDEKTPYYEDFGIEKSYYNFIIHDDMENEIWLDTNCGYRGSKPSVTEQILQLFGVRDEDEIYKEKKIKKENVELINDLNILFLTYKRESNKSKELLMIKIKPNSAKDRYNLLKGLENIGTFKNYEKKMSEYELRFKYCYNDKSFGDNKVNNIFFISRHLNDISVSNLENIIKTIIYKNVGEATEIEIKLL